MQHFKFVNWRIGEFVFWCHEQVIYSGFFDNNWTIFVWIKCVFINLLLWFIYSIILIWQCFFPNSGAPTVNVSLKNGGVIWKLIVRWEKFPIFFDNYLKIDLVLIFDVLNFRMEQTRKTVEISTVQMSTIQLTVYQTSSNATILHRYVPRL